MFSNSNVTSLFTFSFLVAFCRALEEDAQERAARREKRLQLGKVLKCQGNEAFRDEQYQKALICYSDAIEQLPGDTTLYTNRALVSIFYKY